MRDDGDSLRLPLELTGSRRRRCQLLRQDRRPARVASPPLPPQRQCRDLTACCDMPRRSQSVQLVAIALQWVISTRGKYSMSPVLRWRFMRAGSHMHQTMLTIISCKLIWYSSCGLHCFIHD